MPLSVEGICCDPLAVLRHGGRLLDHQTELFASSFRTLAARRQRLVVLISKSTVGVKRLADKLATRLAKRDC